MYHANMCGLRTVDYEVSPLSHILCKYGFNDILSIPPLPTRHSRRYRNSHLLSLVNITQPPSSHLVLMFSKDQISLSRAANTGDLCCQVSPAIIEFCNTLQSDAPSILTENCCCQIRRYRIINLD